MESIVADIISATSLRGVLLVAGVLVVVVEAAMVLFRLAMAGMPESTDRSLGDE